MSKPRRHGTAYSYRKGCRCGECTQAKRDEVRRARRDLDARLSGGNVKHGSPAVYNRGCRCVHCSIAGHHERLWAKFKISGVQYDELMAAQCGVCAICGRLPDGKRLAVDHDHDCYPGKTSCGECVRGLLCSDCNSAIGYLRDDPHAAENAAAYLRKFQTH